MKRIIIILIAVVLFSSCKELSRNNPYDPESADFIGKTYEGEKWYPENTDVISMINYGGILTLAANKSDGAGYCIIKLTSSSTAHIVGMTGTSLTAGTFSGLSDLCTDGLGNIFIVDKKAYVQKMDAGETFSQWPLSYTNGVGKMYIECFNDVLYITNSADDIILKYQKNGSFVDSLTVSVNAQGYSFTPGNIFSTGTYIYVVNSDRKKEVLKLDENLNIVEEIMLNKEVMDGVKIAAGADVLNDAVVYQMDGDLNILTQWGNFGEGPGKVLNGKLIAVDESIKETYILDGSTIKIFGE